MKNKIIMGYSVSNYDGILSRPSDGVRVKNCPIYNGLNIIYDENGDPHLDYDDNDVVYDVEGNEYHLVTNLKVIDMFRTEHPDLFEKASKENWIFAAKVIPAIKQ